jgi:SAM-dependent methyltransferase
MEQMLRGGNGMREMKKLNLGSGDFKKEGYLNVDWNPDYKPDFVHDLNNLPWPFPNSSFDVVEADHVLEHLVPDPIVTMREIHRILKPEGLAIIRAPHASRAMFNSEHRHGFGAGFPLMFKKLPNHSCAYAGISFELVDMKLNWAHPGPKRGVLTKYILSVARRMINQIANRNIVLCDAIWCYWVGGFDEIAFTFKKIEDGNEESS